MDWYWYVDALQWLTGSSPLRLRMAFYIVSFKTSKVCLLSTFEALEKPNIQWLDKYKVACEGGGIGSRNCLDIVSEDAILPRSFSDTPNS